MRLDSLVLRPAQLRYRVRDTLVPAGGSWATSTGDAVRTGRYCQDLSRSARLWKLRDMQGVRAFKRKRRPSDMRL